MQRSHRIAPKKFQYGFHLEFGLSGLILDTILTIQSDPEFGPLEVLGLTVYSKETKGQFTHYITMSMKLL